MEEAIRDNTNLLFPISYSLFPKEGNLLFPIKVWKTVPNSRKHQYIKTKYQWIKIFFFVFIHLYFLLFSFSGIQFPCSYHVYHVLIASRRPQAFKEDTDSTDATDLFFHGFLFYAFGLCAPLAHGFLRIFPSLEAIQRRQAQRNP